MNIGNIPPIVLYILFIWSTIWKGFALWRSAKQNQRNWFIAILILNTAGLLELSYLFYFSKKRLSMTEIKSWKPW